MNENAIENILRRFSFLAAEMDNLSVNADNAVAKGIYNSNAASYRNAIAIVLSELER